MNPLLQHELRLALRRRRTFWLMAIYVTALTAGLALSYPHALKLDLVASTLGRGVFFSLTAIQLGLVLLVTPALSVMGLASERERGTLDLLRVTPLARWELVWAKFAAPLAQVLLLVGSSLPLTAVALLLGGVAPIELFSAYVAIAAAATLCSAIGVLQASATEGAVAALANAYLSLPLYALGFAALWLIGLSGAALVCLEALFAVIYFASRRQLVRSFAYAAMGVCCASFVPLLTGARNCAAAWWLSTDASLLGATAVLVLGCLNEARKKL